MWGFSSKVAGADQPVNKNRLKPRPDKKQTGIQQQNKPNIKGKNSPKGLSSHQPFNDQNFGQSRVSGIQVASFLIVSINYCMALCHTDNTLIAAIHCFLSPTLYNSTCPVEEKPSCSPWNWE